jgi:trans-aconitate methyltransferase
MKETVDWQEYYRKIEGREPRPLLLDVLERYVTDAPQSARQAIDLGSGDGIESAILLERGWSVLAVDSEPSALDHLLARIPSEAQARLQTQVTKFEDVHLPSADLIHASFSLPFCAPEHFDALWDKIVASLKPDGRFAGQFFGVRDTWADQTDMTFLTEDQARARFEKFDIESFQETDEDGHSTSGPKHWHVFTVIARKR